MIGLAGQGSVRGHTLVGVAGECSGFVVVLAGLQAVVEHADAAVGEVAGGGAVAVAVFPAAVKWAWAAGEWAIIGRAHR